MLRITNMIAAVHDADRMSFKQIVLSYARSCQVRPFRCVLRTVGYTGYVRFTMTTPGGHVLLQKLKINLGWGSMPF